MKNSLKRKVFIIPVIVSLSFVIFFVLNQFLVMPWEKFEMPKLENPRLTVKKSERKLYVFDGEKLIKTYDIVLGFTPVGDKEKEGDGKTPEGDFYVFVKNNQSKFYLSLGVSYPSVEDAQRGLKENLISREEHDAIIEAINNKKMPPQNTKLGGAIYIHGGGVIKDWTWGCMALRDEEMKEIFDAVPVGANIRIEP
ncbi:MAG TPA: L,D-transpeptidase [Pyrinomonadaceae bacterium]|nr:L,D-transpeptidase [Pyrinomonadaceae bacterium]